MNKNLLCAAVAAAASFGFSNPAQAVAIYFDFTGTVTEDWTDPSRVGRTITGGFVLETSSLGQVLPSFPNTLQYLDGPATNPGPRNFSTHFSLESPAFPMNSGSFGFASVIFYDWCDAADTTCQRISGESFGMDVETSTFDPFRGQTTGTFDFTRLHFQSQSLRESDYPYNFTEYFDLDDGINLTSIVTLPTAFMTGYYNHAVQDCVAGSCTPRSIEATFFNVDTVTRSIGVSSVPEPGTLGLLGVALAGMFFLRRRPAFQRGFDRR